MASPLRARIALRRFNLFQGFNVLPPLVFGIGNFDLQPGFFGFFGNGGELL